MNNNNRPALRIQQLMVVIISVLLVLTLVTTISFDASTWVYAAAKKAKPKMPSVTSDSYIVMSGSTSEVVIDQHAERKMSPGRITMLMTAMVAIDNMYNDDELNNTVDITKKMAKYGEEFKKGETISVGDLLNAMLIGGSEESAEALASYSASKRKVFVREMNSKALALGLMDTHFTNPSGEYNTSQYTTAHDAAKIFQAAIRYPHIKEAFEEKSYKATAAVKKSMRTVVFKSVNPLLTGSSAENLYEFTKGGIMGTLGSPIDASQYAGAALVDDMQLIVILMDSEADKVAYEAKGLLEYANTKVTRNTIVKAGKHVGNVRVRGGESTRVPVYTETRGFAYVPPEGSDELIRTETVIFRDIEAPLSAGDKVGEFRIFVADELKGTVDLIVNKDVPRGWLPSRIYISNRAVIVIGVILLVILLFFIRVLQVRRRRKKIRALRRQRRLEALARQQMEIEEDRRARNWSQTAPYDKVAPRTGDLRREAIEEAIREDKKAARIEKKRQAARNKARKS